MKKINVKLFFTAILGVLCLSSCLKDNDQVGYYPQAVFTMVNAYSPTQAVIYRADQNAIQSPLNPLTFKSYTFSYLFPGNRRIQTIASDSKTIVDTLYTFKDSTYYTSFVYGSESTPKHLIATDKLLGSLDNKSALRFLHLANNIGKVDIYIGDEETARFPAKDPSSVQPSDDLVFTAHNSGKQKIIVKDEHHTKILEREFDFAPGIHYSIILIGDKLNDQAPLYIGVVKQY